MDVVYTAIPKSLHFAHQFILQDVIERGCAPITPYGITFWLLDTVDRDKIREVNTTYVRTADEVWAYGTPDDIGGEHSIGDGLNTTDGVIAETELALESNTPVRVFELDVDTQNVDEQDKIRP